MPNQTKEELGEPIVERILVMSPDGDAGRVLYFEHLTLREAAIAAYAYSQRDFNTWNYWEKYLSKSTAQPTYQHIATCGGWIAVSEEHTRYGAPRRPAVQEVVQAWKEEEN